MMKYFVQIGVVIYAFGVFLSTSTKIEKDEDRTKKFCELNVLAQLVFLRGKYFLGEKMANTSPMLNQQLRSLYYRLAKLKRFFTRPGLLII